MNTFYSKLLGKTIIWAAKLAEEVESVDKRCKEMQVAFHQQGGWEWQVKGCVELLPTQIGAFQREQEVRLDKKSGYLWVKYCTRVI